MLVTISWISENYKKYNNLCFGGILPNIDFKISKSKRIWGYASYTYDWDNDTIIPKAITMSNYYDSPELVKLQILLHEMIHIYDYTINPEHFIKNGRKVSSRRYDAHGYWFIKECERLKRDYNFVISTKVSKEESEASEYSESVKSKLAEKNKNSLIVAIIGNNDKVFYYKTNIFHIEDSMKRAKRCAWTEFPTGIKTIKVYNFTNDRLANMRSCGKNLSGWFVTIKNFTEKLVSISAIENKNYSNKYKSLLKAA